MKNTDYGLVISVDGKQIATVDISDVEMQTIADAISKNVSDLREHDTRVITWKIYLDDIQIGTGML